MNTLVSRCGMTALFLCTNLFLAAQQPASSAGTGTVTGHVVAGDTQRPARFAHVSLFGIPAEVTPYVKPDPNADEAAQLAAMTAAIKSIGTVSMVNVQTDTDGSYVATDVAPGDYYVFATTSGYVGPINQVEALVNGGADLKKPLPGIPTVHVVADHGVNIDISMQRGAAISGSVQWDDGSPLAGAIMNIVPVKGDSKPPKQFNMLAMADPLGAFSRTDDLGHFRMAGLAPGEYLITATILSGLQTGLGTNMNLNKVMAATPLVVYAPSAFHKADAKSITLHSAEEASDQQLTLKLGGLHTISGRVASAEDRHGINSAIIRVTDTQDKDFVRTASVDAAGNYSATFVPPGTYDLKVVDAEDTEPVKKTAKDKTKLFNDDKTIRSYKDGTLTAIVTDSDLTGQNFDLAIEKNPKPGPDLNKAFEGLSK